jgi:hypothetical protein
VASPFPRFVPQVNWLKDTGEGGGRRGNGVCDGTELCNGTVLDRLTGAIWLADADCFGPQNWVSALASANTLQSGQCGLADGSTPGVWRLPNIRELMSLVDFQCTNPALLDHSGTGCFNTDPAPAFSGVQPNFYWSSSTSTINPAFALGVYFGAAEFGSLGKDGALYVWPVRNRH